MVNTSPHLTKKNCEKIVKNYKRLRFESLEGEKRVRGKKLPQTPSMTKNVTTKLEKIHLE